MLIFALHYALDLAAQAALWVAYRHVCRTRWHRLLIWQAGTIATALVTIHAIG